MACDCKYFWYIQRPIFIILNLLCKNYIYMFTYNLHWKFLAFTVTLIAAKTCTCGRQLKLFYFNCHVFKCIHVHVLFYLQGSEVIILLWNHTLKIEHPHMIPILSHPSQSSSCYLYIYIYLCAKLKFYNFFHEWRDIQLIYISAISIYFLDLEIPKCLITVACFGRVG